MSSSLWLLALFSVFGTWLVVERRWQGYAVLAVANSLWVAVNVCAGLYAQAALLCVYTLMAVIGAVKWLKIK